MKIFNGNNAPILKTSSDKNIYYIITPEELEKLEYVNTLKLLLTTDFINSIDSIKNNVDNVIIFKNNQTGINEQISANFNSILNTLNTLINTINTYNTRILDIESIINSNPPSPTPTPTPSPSTWNENSIVVTGTYNDNKIIIDLGVFESQKIIL